MDLPYRSGFVKLLYKGGFAKALYRGGFTHIYTHMHILVFFPTDMGDALQGPI